MKYGIGACALSLLIAGTMNADTKIDQLKTVFEVSYKSTFNSSKNVIMQDLNIKPLVESINDIANYIKKAAKQYKVPMESLVQAFGLITSAISEIRRDYVRPLNGEMVMLTYGAWVEIKKLAENNLGTANKKIQEAQESLFYIKKPARNTEDVGPCLAAVVDKLNDATAQVFVDIQKARNDAKAKQYTPDQAFKKGQEIIAIKASGDALSRASDEKKKDLWNQMMNIAGFDHIVSNENYNAFLHKFGIEEGKPMDSGLNFTGKGSVNIAIKTLYGYINRKN